MYMLCIRSYWMKQQTRFELQTHVNVHCVKVLTKEESGEKGYISSLKLFINTPEP